MSSCKSSVVIGEYNQFPWNQNKLIISYDSSYTENINSELGSSLVIKGKWQIIGRYLITKPDINNHIKYDTVNRTYFKLSESIQDSSSKIDSFEVALNVHPNEFKTNKFLIKNNLLLPVVKVKNNKLKFDKCSFVKFSNNQRKNKRLKKLNHINCLTSNRFRRIYYRFIY